VETVVEPQHVRQVRRCVQCYESGGSSAESRTSPGPTSEYRTSGSIRVQSRAGVRLFRSVATTDSSTLSEDQAPLPTILQRGFTSATSNRMCSGIWPRLATRFASHHDYSYRSRTQPIIFSPSIGSTCPSTDRISSSLGLTHTSGSDAPIGRYRELLPDSKREIQRAFKINIIEIGRPCPQRANVTLCGLQV
jgi:hypothetical protein